MDISPKTYRCTIHTLKDVHNISYQNCKSKPKRDSTSHPLLCTSWFLGQQQALTLCLLSLAPRHLKSMPGAIYVLRLARPKPVHSQQISLIFLLTYYSVAERQSEVQGGALAGDCTLVQNWTFVLLGPQASIECLSNQPQEISKPSPSLKQPCSPPPICWKLEHGVLHFSSLERCKDLYFVTWSLCIEPEGGTMASACVLDQSDICIVIGSQYGIFSCQCSDLGKTETSPWSSPPKIQHKFHSFPSVPREELRVEVFLPITFIWSCWGGCGNMARGPLRFS